MSLLNKMLQDLDQRRAAAGERGVLPDAVRPLPSGPRGRPLPWLIGLAAVALAAGAAGWMYWRPAPVPQPAPLALLPPPPPAMPVIPAAPTAPIVAPAPARTAPAAAPKPAQLAEKAVSSTDTGVRPMSAPPATERSATAPRSTPVPSGASRVEKTPSIASAQAQAESEYRRAQGLIGQGRGADAEAALQQALRLAPEHAQARQALFNLLMDLRRQDEARAVLEEGLRVLPGHVGWAMNLARMQMERNDAAGAWETLQRSLPAAGANGDYQAFCGTVLHRLGRSQEAIAFFNKALRMNPAEGRWWLGLGLALEAADHPAEAREAFRRAKGVGNLSPELAAYADQKSRQ